MKFHARLMGTFEPLLLILSGILTVTLLFAVMQQLAADVDARRSGNALSVAPADADKHV